MKKTPDQALESLINPHFLYNSLRVISSRTLLTGDRQLYKMIEALAANLRYSFRESSLVSIGIETEYVKNYLLLLRARFDERLSTHIEAAPEAERFLIPKLTIFTLIENSVAHNLESSMEHLNITLKIQKKENRLLLSVTDDGAGITPERLCEIRSLLKKDCSAAVYGNHIGLQNVNARLKLRFGENVKMELESIQNEYTTTSIEILLSDKEVC